MSKHYSAKVDSKFSYDIDESAISKLDISKLSPSEFHILHENKSVNAKITEADFNSKTYTITINNTAYQVEISNPLDLLIKDMGFEIGASKQINNIKAPMPGLILDINVEVGQSVKENDSLLILEAMKMENNLTSPRDGVIKTIAITQGEAVDKNQLLIEFE